MRRTATTAAVLIALTVGFAVAQPTQWAIDPAQSGENLPPVGRSLFDDLVVVRDGATWRYQVPFPFAALVKAIETRLVRSSDGAPPFERVLIPLGRSLQRLAPAPDFFAFPRIVVAVDGDAAAPPGRAPMPLKDRLYLGYQEKAGILEVISYNEAAGRFEFQVVKDYRAGSTPQVFYANRALCTACHQNQAPIFSRAEWQETNANPAVAALLHGVQRDFFGVPIDPGVDVPFAVQSAADRANRIAAVQRLWRDGCGAASPGAECRTAALVGALQCRLSGSGNYDRQSASAREFASSISNNANVLWPDGLRIPDPDLPNRNPLQTFAVADASNVTELMRAANVPAAFEPLNPRAPLETWRAADAADRLVRGLAEHFTAADIQPLDAFLFAHSASRPRRQFTSPCRLSATYKRTTIDRIKLQCAGDALRLDGRVYFSDGKVNGGRLAQLAIGTSDTMSDVRVVSGTVADNGGRRGVTLQLAPDRGSLHLRGSNGQAIERLELTWPTAATAAPSAATFSGEASAGVVEDFTALSEAVAAMASATNTRASDAFAAQPFRRSVVLRALQAELKMPPLTWPNGDTRGWPSAVMAPGNDGAERPPDFGAHADPALALFYRQCAVCHQSSDRFPPNFLSGSAEQVRANLAHCAERIFVRLDMWRLPSAQRPKSPMPPATFAEGVDAPARAEYLTLRSYAGALLAAEGRQAPRAEDYSMHNYEELRPCLP